MQAAEAAHAIELCRVPELSALLDAETAFPAAPLDSEEALAALTRLGMRASIAPESILQSAWYIAELGLRDPDQAHERCLLFMKSCLFSLACLPWTILATFETAVCIANQSASRGRRCLHTQSVREAEGHTHETAGV